MEQQRSPLFAMHESAGAEFTEFGGWMMPVAFESIRTEHQAVRDSAGIFDVSHMSEIEVNGPDASALMNTLTTNDIGALSPGDAQYACILDEDGIILDDTVVYRYPDREGYLFVPNAGHGEWMTERWTEHAAALGLSVQVTNRTMELGLVAVQGPDAVARVDAVAAEPVRDLERFSCRRTAIDGVECLVARTGYTGEDGFEICFDASEATAVWEAFSAVPPCGLGARDTLRIEAGLLLSGQDFDPADEPRTPFEARLGFAVATETEFVGRDSLVAQRRAGLEQQLVGLRIDGRGIARNGYAVVADGEEIGHVTSGTQSPTFDIPLAVGYIDTGWTDPGTTVAVQVREREVDATVVNHRFLDTMEQ